MNKVRLHTVKHSLAGYKWLVIALVILVGAGVAGIMAVGGEERQLKHQEKLLQLPQPDSRSETNTGCKPWSAILGAAEGCYLNTSLLYRDTSQEKLIREHLLGHGWSEHITSLGYFILPQGVRGTGPPFTKETPDGIFCAGLEPTASAVYFHLLSSNDDVCQQIVKDNR